MAIIVSHDRWFLDRLCTHIIAFEKHGVTFFEGNYQEYEEDKRKRLGNVSYCLLLIAFEGDSSQKIKFVKIEKV